MIKLQKEIKSTFGTKHTPNTNQLVIEDGFDVLEKEGAVKFFSGKSLENVLEHLQSRKGDVLAGADYQLEEWSVLKPSARYYYLRAYLEFLLETLSERDPDGGYIPDLFHQLYQTVYMYGAEAYSNEQKALLRKIAALTLETIKNHKGIEDLGEDITDNINVFLSELEKHG
ncbi:MAG: hypothetical protein AB8B92_09310 [Gammaproteobacteria bacterium]